MVFSEKKKHTDLSLRDSNRPEYERARAIHFVRVTATHFRESFRYLRYCSLHFRDYLKYSVIAAIRSGCRLLDLRKLLKRKT